MKNSIPYFLVLTLCSLTLFGQDASEKQEADSGQDEWISMFNGEDLTGWTPKIKGHELGSNYANTFRVENGVLKVAYDQYEGDFNRRFGHLFYKDNFEHYIMKLDYRFVGDQATGGPGWAFRNSGVMVHGQDPNTMDVDQDFPVSIEVQLLGGNGTDDRTTLNLCTPGTHVEMDGKLVKRHCNTSTSKTYHGDQWVTVEIEVLGNKVVRHKIDGETVLEYQKPQLDPGDKDAKKLITDGNVQLSGGSISLQAESHGVEFRNIMIKPLNQD